MELLYHNLDFESLAGGAKTNGATRDLLLLVLALPKTEGLEVWKKILGDQSLDRLPMAIFIAPGNQGSRVFGLDKSAHSKLKRTSNIDLVAHVKRLLRRAESERPADRLIEAGELVIDPSAYRVTQAGNVANLTLREFRLLRYLASHPNQPFQRSELLSAVWTGSPDMNVHTVDACVRRLRVKLERNPKRPAHLKTLRGVGYLFDPAPEGTLP